MTFYAFSTVSRCASTMVVCVNLMLALTSSFHADNNNNNNNSGKGVMTLTTKNFDAVVAETEHLLVQFCE